MASRHLPALLLLAVVQAVDICDERYVLDDCGERDTCINRDVPGKEFQPEWERNPNNLELGLACIDKKCRQRLRHGEECEDSEQCESRVCIASDVHSSGRTVKKCLGLGTIRPGGRCPDEMIDHTSLWQTTTVNNLCAGDSFCWPADYSAKLNEKTAFVCTPFPREGEGCLVHYDDAGTTPLGHTCHPFLSELYCHPQNTTQVPQGGTSPTIGDRLIEGVCRIIPEQPGGESCAVIPGTSVRPHCEFDHYCNLETQTCQGQVDGGAQCTSHEACRMGHGCDTITKTCVEHFTLGEGKQADSWIYCKIDHLWNSTSQNCMKIARTGSSCSRDSDCVEGTWTSPPGFWNRFFCDQGVCRDLLPGDCEDSYKDYMSYREAMQESHRVLQKVACHDEEKCFPLRIVFEQMRKRSEGFACCLHDNLDDHLPGSCARVQNKEGWNTGTLFGAIHLSDHYRGDICPPKGMTVGTIVALALVLGFFGMMVAFVLIKELVLAAPEDHGSDKSSTKSGSASEVVHREIVAEDTHLDKKAAASEPISDNMQRL